jgi:hypothetical protein
MYNVVATVTGAVGRAIRAIPESRQKQIERETAELIARSGGRLTDSLEFEMMRHLLGERGALEIGQSTSMRH